MFIITSLQEKSFGYVDIDLWIILLLLENFLIHLWLIMICQWYLHVQYALFTYSIHFQQFPFDMCIFE
jgi:hypothetical protein